MNIPTSNISTNATEFLALLKKFDQGSLTWSDDNTRLVLTVGFVTYWVRYLAPTPMDMDVLKYESFLAHVDLIRKGLPEFNEVKKIVPENVMTAEKFLEITRNSKSISVGEDNENGGIWFVVKYHSDEHDDDLVETYQGPDPMTTTYGDYMSFLAELYSIPGLANFVENYQKKVLRRRGRMTK